MLGKYWFERPKLLYIKIALRSMFLVREFEPWLFDPGVYFYIKYIGNLLGLTNEFQRSMVFETGEFD